MTPARCAVALPVAGAQQVAQAAAAAAIECLARSPWLETRPLPVDIGLGEVGWRNAAIAEAADAGDAWLFLLAPGERIASALPNLLAPALQAYDLVWGGIEVPGQGGEAEVPRIARFACSREVDAYHMALHWWVGQSHLIRTAAALEAPFRAAAGDAWYADYLVRHWQAHRCLKTAQPLTTASSLPQVAPADRQYLLAELDRSPRPIPVPHSGRTLLLPYTGRNPTVERVQLRGVFFEAAELAAVAARIGPGATIVDVGANTGNHTVYFAAVMGAARVIPVEPGALACRALRWAIDVNALTNVDTSCLGKAAGAAPARASHGLGRRGHLGTATLDLSPDGNTDVFPLDDLVDARIDLIKIDAEGMEVDVLMGARRLIQAWRPVIIVEITDRNLAAFLPLARAMGYVVEQIFPDEGYANYLLVPAPSHP